MSTANLADNCSHALDAIITEGPANTGYDPVFQFEITCEDSEQHFNKCHHARPQTGSCTQLAISCRKSTSKKGSKGSSVEDDDRAVTGAVVGVMVFILLAVLLVVAVLLLLVLSTKRHRRKQLERMQLDILAM